jgi:hypothetical protein
VGSTCLSGASAAATTGPCGLYVSAVCARARIRVAPPSSTRVARGGVGQLSFEAQPAHGRGLKFEARAAHGRGSNVLATRAALPTII